MLTSYPLRGVVVSILLKQEEKTMANWLYLLGSFCFMAGSLHNLLKHGNRLEDALYMSGSTLLMCGTVDHMVSP